MMRRNAVLVVLIAIVLVGTVVMISSTKATGKTLG